jgi:type IV pilus assembly protein PilC
MYMNESIDIRKLRKGLRQIVDLEPAPKKNKLWDILNTDIRFSRKLLSDKVKESFYIELSSLLEAGVDINTAFELVNEEQGKKRQKKIIDRIQKNILNGSTLSAALKESKEFSTYEYFSVQIGEETGKLIQVLKDLSEYFSRKVKQRRQVVGAITYPIIVLVVAFAAVSFMVAFVVPMFSDTFKRFGSDLPQITKVVIGLSAFIRKTMGSFLIIISLIIVFFIWQSKKTWFRYASSSILLKMPIIGKIIRKIYLSRFTNTMALLIGSSIPMVQAIQLMKQMITFFPIERSLSDIEKNITAGMTLHKSLSCHSIYPAKMVSIVKVGEEVNHLELFFSRLSDQYSAEAEHQTALLGKFLEPLIIIILGLVVGLILIAMYLPMFKLGQAI